MKIHKEGKRLLTSTFIILLVVNVLSYFFMPGGSMAFSIVAVISFILFLSVLQFFRHPAIEKVMDEKFVLAPADGKIVVIEKVFEPEFLKEERIQISIFMSPVNVHVNRNPVSGIIRYFKYHPGKYLVAWHPKSSTENERTTVVYEMANGIQLLVRQIAGAMARRIKWYISEGDKVQQGSEFGFIKFGSRLDLFLPLDAVIRVEKEQKTKAGMTILAELK